LKKHLVLFASPPDSRRFARGLRIVGSLSTQETPISVAMLQDSVLMATRADSGPAWSAVSSKVSGAYALEEHLVKRGFGQKDLASPFEAIGYGELLDLVMEEGTSVTGAF
jgi:sulfur relay (sulfurtransferase) DsrF/TusC family protein